MNSALPFDRISVVDPYNFDTDLDLYNFDIGPDPYNFDKDLDLDSKFLRYRSISSFESGFGSESGSRF